MRMDATLIKGHLDLILLGVLEDGDKYGLQITREANHRTGGYFDLKVGSLYPALHRLEKAGWITGEFRESPRARTPVKYYRLTPTGREALHAKRDQFRAFASKVEALWSEQ